MAGWQAGRHGRPGSGRLADAKRASDGGDPHRVGMIGGPGGPDGPDGQRQGRSLSGWDLAAIGLGSLVKRVEKKRGGGSAAHVHSRTLIEQLTIQTRGA